MFCIVVCLHLAMQKRTSMAQIVNRQSKTVINLSSSLYQILRFLLPIAILSFKSQSSYCILKQSAKTTKKAKGKTIYFFPLVAQYEASTDSLSNPFLHSYNYQLQLWQIFIGTLRYHKINDFHKYQNLKSKTGLRVIQSLNHVL